MLLYGYVSQQNPWTQPQWLTAVPDLAAGCGNFILYGCRYFRHVFWPFEENIQVLAEQWRRAAF